MAFSCTINEAEAEVKIKVVRSKPTTPLETLRMEKNNFIRRYRTRIPAFTRELLLKKEFSFNPEAFKAKAYNDGDDYTDNDYDEETGYLQCQKQCLARYK